MNDAADGWKPLPGLESRVWWRHSTRCTQFNDELGMLMFFADGFLDFVALALIAKAISAGIYAGEQAAMAKIRLAIGMR